MKTSHIPFELSKSTLSSQNVPEKEQLHQNSEIAKPYLFQIPLELLENLLDKYIPHDDKLSLRRVHPIFKFLYDAFIGFKVTLDNEDTASKFDFISGLAIRNASIQNLTCQLISSNKQEQFLATLDRQSSSLLTFDEIFLFPQLLQEVKIKGNIDVDIFNEIIRKCIALKSLEFCPGCNIKQTLAVTVAESKKKLKKKSATQQVVLPEIDILSSSSSSCTSHHYMSRVRSVKLLLNQDSDSLLDFEESNIPSDLNTEAVCCIMKSLCSPLLEKAVIQGWISPRFTVSLLTLLAAECLERNRKIESFFLGVIYEHLISDQDPPENEEEDTKLRLAITEKLKKAGDKLNVKKFGISTKSGDMILWKHFLKRQQCLVHISFTVDLVEGVFSSEMFRPSCTTLRQIILRGKFLTSFDFNWIEDCLNLKEICLHNIDHTVEHATATNLHAVNSSSIPAGLESLVLFQICIRSDDILAAVRKLKLKTLVLFKAGNHGGETGVNVECLKLIFSCRTLQSILLVRFVAQNPVEAAELVTILQTMNDGQIHRQVQVAEEIEHLVPENQVVVDDLELPPPLQSNEEICSASIHNKSISMTKTAIIANESKGEAILLESKDKEDDEMVVESELNTDTTLSPQNNIIEESTTTTTISVQTHTIEAADDVRNNFSKWAAQRRTNNKSDSDFDTTDTILNKEEPNLILELKDEIKHDTEIQPVLPNVEIKDTDSNNNLVTPKTDPEDQVDVNVNVDADADVDDSYTDSEWEDLDETDDDDTDDTDDDDYSFDLNDIDEEAVFDLDLNQINLQVLEQAAAAGQGNVQFILNLQNEDDLHEMLGMLQPIMADNVGAAAAVNNIQFGFILDGVIDIQNSDSKRSRWIAVEDDDGQLTYTLKISID